MPAAAAGKASDVPQAAAVRRGPRAAADADATGHLAPAGDHRPGQLAGRPEARGAREADRGAGGRRRGFASAVRAAAATTSRSASARRCCSATATASRRSSWPTAATGWSAGSSRSRTPTERIDLAVRNVLSRPPTRTKIASSWPSTSASAQDRPVEACRQLVWALLTSSEFRFNH